jgi:hypothetical protein
MMKQGSFSLALFGLLGLLTASPVYAQVNAAPSLLNYQGRIANSDGNPVPDGTYSIRFSLWDAASAGTEKWNQTIANVQVKNGTFAVLLNTNTAGLFNGNLWLETKIGTDTALTPRQQLVSVAYAMKANSVPDGSITGASIANSTLTANKFASDALGWLLGGNAATASSFLGTTNNQPLVFRTNNTEKMRLLANGYLGIGTTTPGMSLEAAAPSYYGGPALGASNGASRWTYLHVGPSEHSFMWNTGSPLRFGVEPSRGSGYAERMRITDSGNVGIGTQTPLAKLSVAGTGRTYETSDGTRTLVHFLGGGGDGAYIGTSSNHPLFLQANNTAYVTLLPNGNFGIGTATPGVKLDVAGEIRGTIVTVTGGSDVAEPYHVAPAGEVKPVPGMVVCIDGAKVGQMKVAGKAYDKTVAGILSGANGINPGITLTQKGTVADGELPVASIGRVWCWCDADANGSIEAGDMLTTSDTPGHAMKVDDHNKANGAVIGKAMSSLKSGKGLVLVLVSLK